MNILFVLSLLGIFLLIGIYGGIKFELINLTGFALNNRTHINITIQSTAPVIYFVSPITASQSVTESSYSDISFYVYVLEYDGISTIRNSSAMNASAAYPGATTRINQTCERIANINATAANYSCTVRMWYWDAGGDWTINVSVNDTSGSVAATKNNTFTLGITTAIVMAPDTLTWTSMASTQTNQTPTNTPLVINNTANKNMTKINITAINLQGITDTSKMLNASDFSANYTTGGSPAFECGGYVLKNQTAATDMTEITGMTINPNNNTAGFGNSTIYVCMLRVTTNPVQATPQDYSTSNVGRWTITVG